MNHVEIGKPHESYFEIFINIRPRFIIILFGLLPMGVSMRYQLPRKYSLLILHFHRNFYGNR
jgi:hypothetical protein